MATDSTDSRNLLGQVLGTCRLQSLLGQGGMGAVFLAQQSRPRREVAVKVLLPGFVQDSNQYLEFLTRFRREADAIATLDHMHIIPIYEYGEQEQFAYLVMPYVSGGTLYDILQERRKLPLYKVLAITEQAASALDYAHEHGIVHRDLKPANIMFHADGRVLLADFGLAKLLTHIAGTLPPKKPSTLTNSNIIIGTPDYLSPEQASGDLIDRRTDIYAFGVILYEMLCGRLPFIAQTSVAVAIKHAMEEPPPPSIFNPAISHGVEAVILKALAKKPEKRYASAGELARALRSAAISMYGVNSQSEIREPGNSLPPPSPLSNDTIPEVPAVSSPTMIVPASPASLRSSKIPEAPTHPLPEAVIPRTKAPARPRNQRNGLVAVLLGLIVLLLVSGGLLAYANHLLPGSPSPAANATPTATSTTQQAPANPLPPISVGKLIFQSPIPACGNDRALWSLVGDERLTCSNPTMELANLGKHFQVGAFLNRLPNGSTVPDDFLLHTQIQPGPGSTSKFGVYFRNQPEAGHQGTYSFMLDPAGYWNAYAYDDHSGSPIWLAGGNTTNIAFNSLMTMDLIVKGNTFTLYLNEIKQGSVRDSAQRYLHGTPGFAVDVEAKLLVRNLAIYNLP